MEELRIGGENLGIGMDERRPLRSQLELQSQLRREEANKRQQLTLSGASRNKSMVSDPYFTKIHYDIFLPFLHRV